MPTVECKNCKAVWSVSVIDRDKEIKKCVKCPSKKQGKVEKITETKEKGKRMFGGYGVDEGVEGEK